jgi:hypothetical protein
MYRYNNPSGYGFYRPGSNIRIRQNSTNKQNDGAVVFDDGTVEIIEIKWEENENNSRLGKSNRQVTNNRA